MSTDEDALIGGQWVRRGLVMVWQPAPPPRTWETVHDLIACTTCLARVDEPCRHPGGKATSHHAGRLVARRCPCGGTVGRWRRYCRACRVRAIRAGQRSRRTDEGVAT